MKHFLPSEETTFSNSDDLGLNRPASLNCCSVGPLRIDGLIFDINGDISSRNGIGRHVVPLASDIVFILGAGASFHCGGPLMRDFLDRAFAIHYANPTGRYKDDFERVFSAVAALQQIHSKSELDLRNLESVFTTLELARVVRRFP